MPTPLIHITLLSIRLGVIRLGTQRPERSKWMRRVSVSVQPYSSKTISFIIASISDNASTSEVVVKR